MFNESIEAFLPPKAVYVDTLVPDVISRSITFYQPHQSIIPAVMFARDCFVALHQFVLKVALQVLERSQPAAEPSYFYQSSPAVLLKWYWLPLPNER